VIVIQLTGLTTDRSHDEELAVTLTEPDPPLAGTAAAAGFSE
jgi:hypothetical protein